MAKRRANKKAAKAPKRGGKRSVKGKIKSPRSAVLPGFEQVRNGRLDTVCEGIADERRIKNAAQLEEASLITTAQRIMEAQTPSLTVYKHAGVELALIPGTSHIRVRLVKETGDADVSGGRQRASNAGDTEEPATEMEGAEAD